MRAYNENFSPLRQSEKQRRSSMIAEMKFGKRDPLANINLESEDFYQITKQIVDLSKIHSKGRIISFLEGGYDLLALSESIKHHLLALKN